MQRLHPKDLVGYLKEKEFDLWDFVEIPLVNENGVIANNEFTPEAVELIKQNTLYKFYSQYQQKPQNDLGNSPFADHIEVNYFDKSGCIAYLDPSFKGKDYTALCLAKRNFSNMNILGFMFKKSWDDCLIEIAEICNVYRVEKIDAINSKNVEMIEWSLYSLFDKLYWGMVIR